MIFTALYNTICNADFTTVIQLSQCDHQLWKKLNKCGSRDFCTLDMMVHRWRHRSSNRENCDWMDSFDEKTLSMHSSAVNIINVQKMSNNLVSKITRIWQELLLNINYEKVTVILRTYSDAGKTLNYITEVAQTRSFRLPHSSIYWKSCKMELRSQLITNRKSYSKPILWTLNLCRSRWL